MQAVFDAVFDHLELSERCEVKRLRQDRNCDFSMYIYTHICIYNSEAEQCFVSRSMTTSRPSCWNSFDHLKERGESLWVKLAAIDQHIFDVVNYTIMGYYNRYSYIDNYHTLSQLMWLKQCHFYHPWLGMVWIPPIYDFMVMTWGWFMALEVYGIRFNLTTLCHCYARYEAPWKSQV